MIERVVRFEVELLSHLALAQYMVHRDETVRSLAEDVERRLRKAKSKTTCSRAQIGHLRSGHRKYVKPEIANAIEDSLGAPRGSLFMPKVSSVSSIAGRAA